MSESSSPRGRPDPFGEPRPPAAPRSGGACRYRTVVLHLDPRRPRRRWRVGPAERPPLEAVVVPWRVRLAEAGWETAGLGLVVLVGLGLYLWWSGMDWVGLAWIWVGAVVLIFLWRYAVSDVPAPVVAGSDWVGTAYGRGSRVVPLYELTRIDAAPDVDGDGEPVAGTTALALQAGDPRYALEVDLALLQANPALWDLVYRGIRSSVDAGAELTPAAREALRG